MRYITLLLVIPQRQSRSSRLRNSREVPAAAVTNVHPGADFKTQVVTNRLLLRNCMIAQNSTWIKNSVAQMISRAQATWIPSR